MNPYLLPEGFSAKDRLDPEFSAVRQERPLALILFQLGVAATVLTYPILVRKFPEVRPGFGAILAVAGLLGVLSMAVQFFHRLRRRARLQKLAWGYREPVVRIGEGSRMTAGGRKKGMIVLTREELVFLDPVTGKADEMAVPLKGAASMVRQLGEQITDGRLSLPLPGGERLSLILPRPKAWAEAIRHYSQPAAGKVH